MIIDFSLFLSQNPAELQIPPLLLLILDPFFLLFTRASGDKNIIKRFQNPEKKWNQKQLWKLASTECLSTTHVKFPENLISNNSSGRSEKTGSSLMTMLYRYNMSDCILFTIGWFPTYLIDISRSFATNWFLEHVIISWLLYAARVMDRDFHGRARAPFSLSQLPEI